jgi:hypothetical protein
MEATDSSKMLVPFYQSIISKKTVIFLGVMSDNFEGQKNTDIARCLVTYAPLSPGYNGFSTVR